MMACYEISIHVPRVEDDSLDCSTTYQTADFNPRPPCGGRPVTVTLQKQKKRISIHVPRVEDDGL